MRWKLLLLVIFVSPPSASLLSASAGVIKEEKSKIKEETVRGTLQDAKSDRATIDVAGKAMTVRLTAETKVKLVGRVGTAADLRPGQEVRCTHIERGGEHVCLELEVLSEKK